MTPWSTATSTARPAARGRVRVQRLTSLLKTGPRRRRSTPSSRAWAAASVKAWGTKCPSGAGISHSDRARAMPPPADGPFSVCSTLAPECRRRRLTPRAARSPSGVSK
ncbi:hypothetical protein AZA_86741 [Nitrospirillum viridazoti Y2]|nr:hypothetical protein AZA_86741 [Nitrospirillum amazonense Y2]